MNGSDITIKWGLLVEKLTVGRNFYFCHTRWYPKYNTSRTVWKGRTKMSDFNAFSKVALHPSAEFRPAQASSSTATLQFRGPQWGTCPDDSKLGVVVNNGPSLRMFKVHPPLASCTFLCRNAPPKQFHDNLPALPSRDIEHSLPLISYSSC